MASGGEWRATLQRIGPEPVHALHASILRPPPLAPLAKHNPVARPTDRGRLRRGGVRRQGASRPARRATFSPRPAAPTPAACSRPFPWSPKRKRASATGSAPASEAMPGTRKSEPETERRGCSDFLAQQGHAKIAAVYLCGGPPENLAPSEPFQRLRRQNLSRFVAEAPRSRPFLNNFK